MEQTIETRVALLENQFLTFREGYLQDKIKSQEFYLRADQRLEALVAESGQWAAVRKTLAWVGSVILTLGAGVGWLVHALWPNGFWGGGH